MPTLKFEVRNRWSGAVQFTADIECDEDASYSVKLGLAVRWAVKTHADLTDADLTDADLTDADLTRADLTRADLTRADLTHADLTRADLTDADLTRAVLTRAVLTRADLTDADLTDADLTRAVLTDAVLTRADLTRADLTRADLTGAVLTRADLTDAKNLPEAALRAIRADLFDILIRARAEVPGLLQALRDGRVDGSTYTGECACLCGTIANIRHVDVALLDFRDASRPAERWFMGIREGDTPDSNPVSKITEGWVKEFLSFAAPAPISAAQEVV